MTPIFALKLLGLAAASTLITTSALAGSPKPPCTTSSRACLEKIGRLYIGALLSHDGSSLPLAPNIRRTENALTNARGPAEVRESFAHTGMVKAAREIQAYVDEKHDTAIFFFVIDVDLGQKDVAADGATQAGGTRYKTAVTVPAGTYTVHEAERFKIVKGMIQDIEIIAHVEPGKDQGSGWPVSRDPVVPAAAPSK
jgi:hypothetical protein